MTHPVARFSLRSRMIARDTGEKHRTASPLELLFDLTFVVAVAQIADQLADAIGRGDGLSRIIPFLMVFFAIWWAWMNFTWFASAFDTDDVPYRFMTLIQMAGVLVLAAGVPAAFNSENFLGITIGYLIMRVGLVGQWIRAAVEDPAGRRTALRYAIGITVVQVGWASRLWLPTDAASQWWSVYLAFVVLVILEVSVPIWAERTGRTGWHPHHIAERYGLFVIILLGETIAALTVGVGGVVSSSRNLLPIVIGAGSLLVLIFGLWWLYFMEPSGDGLERHRGRSYYWGYLHYVIFAALGALGAGIEVVTASVGPHPLVGPLVAAYAVALPTAIYAGVLWAANAPLVARIVLRGWIVWPVIVLLLVVPLAAASIGLDWDVVALALIVAGFVAASVAVKIRTHQIE